MGKPEANLFVNVQLRSSIPCELNLCVFTYSKEMLGPRDLRCSQFSVGLRLPSITDVLGDWVIYECNHAGTMPVLHIDAVCASLPGLD